MAHEGLMIEVSAADIHEGKFLEQLSEGIRRAHEALHKAFKEYGEPGLKCQLKLGTIELQLDKEIDGMVRLTYSTCQVVPPAIKRSSLAKSAGGRLLAQPGGTDENTPDQLRLFTPKGVHAKTVDTRTGEELAADEDPAAPVGQIGGAG
jgi:hypothetical protein